MPKVCYKETRFKPGTRRNIEQANTIIAEYSRQGFDLTLRQLYYQFVARGLLPNNMRSYKNLGNVVNDARMAGLIDWNHITDRTRNLHRLATWDDPSGIVSACAGQFRLDLWEGQDQRPEVWIEKEALSGVFERVCDELRIPFFACRGYTSQSEMWSAAMRLRGYDKAGQVPVILHFGDHDPSGIDMTRDIADRLDTFMGGLDVKRLALNMNQIEEYNPPPNPAKATDSRFDDYAARYGDESWELDALDPNTLAGLVRDAVDGLRDGARWQESLDRENEHKRLLREVSDRWDELTDGL